MQENKGKQYSGNRSLEEIKAKANHWDQSGWDNGEDWINIEFKILGKLRHVLYNGFNGTFITEDKGETVTECNSELDNELWYSELLDILYKPQEEKSNDTAT